MREIIVRTPSREVLVDITSQVEAVVREAGEDFDGLVHVFVPHTTAGLTINEGADPDVARDIVATLARLIPREGGYRHGEANADAHIKTSLVGSSATAPVVRGRVRLGTWQSIYLAEFDGPRTRKVWIDLLAGQLPAA